MASNDTNELRRQAPDWIRDTRADVRYGLEGLRSTLYTALDALATQLATQSQDDVAPLDEIERAAADFLSQTRRELTGLWDRLEEAFVDRLQPLVRSAARGQEPSLDRAEVALQEWRRSLQHQKTTVVQYTSGWIEGGGVALTLMTGLEPHEASSARHCQGLLRQRMGFIADRSEAGLSQWIDEVQRGLEGLIGQVAPAPPPAASTPQLRTARLEELLGKAEALKVRIRNVPNAPSDRYLDKLETQLAGIAEKRAQKLAAREARQARLADLLSFAEQLNVRARGVPENPSEAWLDKMEAKLTQIAERKGIELPQGVQPPSPRETRGTDEPAPERVAAPPTSLRVQELIHKAEDASLPLGRIPEAPSDDWVSEMEGRLETALQEQRERRLDDRRERRQRRDQLVQQATEAGADLGEIPEEPSEDWFAETQQRIQGAIEARVLAATPIEQPPAFDVKRLAEIQQAAASAGVPLGEIPNPPTDDWLAWAELRIREALDAEAALAVEPHTASVASSAYLVYEEGTVQEQVWPVGLEEVTIGRSRGNTIQIRDDAAVSRRHAVLHVHSGQYILRDLNSTKGTYVDDQQIDVERVLHGDEIVQFGDTWFTFRLGPTPSAVR